MSDGGPSSPVPSVHDRWLSGNQQYLLLSLARVRKALLDYLLRSQPDAVVNAVPEPLPQAVDADSLAASMPAPPALLSLCAAFELSAFERDLLLLCVGVELEPAFRRLCQKAGGTAQPTFQLALSALAQPHLSAVSPSGPLRRFGLVEALSSETLTASPLRIDPRILSHLTGLSLVDERLLAVGRLLSPPDEPLGTALSSLAQQIVRLWSVDTEEAPPAVSLFGADGGERLALAQHACQPLGLLLFEVRCADLPHSPAERAQLAKLWAREQSLLHIALLLSVADGDSPETVRQAMLWIAQLPGAVLCSSPTPLRDAQKRMVGIEVPRMLPDERTELLTELFEELDPQLASMRGPGGESLLSELSMQFQIGREAVVAACQRASGMSLPLPQALWQSFRMQARPHLDELARRVEPKVTWDDLVLADEVKQKLRELLAHQRYQVTVLRSWGMAGTAQRGLGVSALLCGQSGTGKTFAAEALAHELQLDLYHIDLSQIVSKYIGETEKNLRRVFDAAEEGGAVLLFDEADALFGKRSEVKDSHDRYANIEVSYLLQRMESYQGITLLTSNLRSALDSAFLRRLRFIIPFPFPDANQRAELWRRAFAKQTPTRGLVFEKLAQLSVTGGQIRNIALCAAFLAASQGQPVGMRHILDAARSEYQKSERPLNENEVRGWL